MTRNSVKFMVTGALLLTLLLFNRTVAGQSSMSPTSTHAPIVALVSAPLASIN
jgi:hypothetical protein